MKRIISAALILLIIGCVIARISPVNATEASTDTVALSQLLYDCIYGPEAGSEDRVYRLGEYFFADPLNFVRTIALEPEEVRVWATQRFPKSMYHSMHPDGYSYFPGTIYNLMLSENETEATRNVLSLIEDAVMQHWGFTKEQYKAWFHADFENLNVESMEDIKWSCLYSWLCYDADCTQLFAVGRKTEGIKMDMWLSAVHRQFERNPYGLIQVLAVQDTIMQERVMDSVVKWGAEMWGMGTQEAFGKFLGSIHLPQSATATEKAILAEMIRRTKEDYGINVPHTHDPIALPAALLLLSAAGIVCLTKRKRVV